MQHTTKLPDPALDVAAEWKTARLEARLLLTRCDRRSAGDRESASDPEATAIAEMEGAASWLAALTPLTIRGAREMLDVAVDILAYRETHSDRDVLSEGPILQILKNIRETLTRLDAQTSTDL